MLTVKCNVFHLPLEEYETSSQLALRFGETTTPRRHHDVESEEEAVLEVQEED